MVVTSPLRKNKDNLGSVHVSVEDDGPDESGEKEGRQLGICP